MQIKLIKEPDNEHDKEAIKAVLEPLGTIGYVANSPYTVLGECMSAGTIKIVTGNGIICAVSTKKKK